jgi:3-deoxy-manno-octulosonate cytidylyltransferase (CMP-KDO synthetase)
MIVRVWRQALAAGLGPVVVAAGEPEIVTAIEQAVGSLPQRETPAGARAVLTDPDLPSGSDRIWAALEAIDPGGAHDVVVNLQGDLPALDPAQIRAVVSALQASGADIATLAAPIDNDADRANPAVVKAVVAWNTNETLGRALYFTRATAPTGDGTLWHHVGLYAYTRAALARFVALPPSPLERREKLEQLRALEAGMTIAVARVDAPPLSVDTPEDLVRARKLLS